MMQNLNMQFSAERYNELPCAVLCRFVYTQQRLHANKLRLNAIFFRAKLNFKRQQFFLLVLNYSFERSESFAAIDYDSRH